MPRFGPVPADPDLEAELDVRLLDAVRRQLSQSLARDAGWPIRLLHGAPAEVIARYAEEHDARMILIGRGPRDARHRVFGGTLAMRLAQTTDVPIMSVAAASHVLPQKVLLALDFSPRSIAAARDALALMSGAKTVYLAHVIPRFDALVGLSEDWEARYAGGMDDAFDAAQREMALPPGVTVERLTLLGHPARELQRAAMQVDADVIVCGTHGAGFVQRMLLGSVASQVMRAATCSVLLVPNAMLREPTAREEERHSDPAVWGEMLRRFTEHNLGRRAILEIDDPAIGAQAQVVDYPFLGAVFDPHTQRAELMFGGDRGTRQHLTHSIGGVRSIDIAEGGDGRDRVLRIAYDSGQALVTLTT